MTVFIALLRAVNVGGSGKMPMRDLVALCQGAGYTAVRTYIASGNAVFETVEPEAAVRTALADRLQAYAGRPVGVVVRSLAQMRQILADNPFPQAAPDRTTVIFLDVLPETDVLAGVVGQQDEEIRGGAREIYVHYPHGIGRSRLRIPAALLGTARNMNTVAALIALASTCG